MTPVNEEIRGITGHTRHRDADRPQHEVYIQQPIVQPIRTAFVDRSCEHLPMLLCDSVTFRVVRHRQKNVTVVLRNQKQNSLFKLRTSIANDNYRHPKMCKKLKQKLRLIFCHVLLNHIPF